MLKSSRLFVSGVALASLILVAGGCDKKPGAKKAELPKDPGPGSAAVASAIGSVKADGAQFESPVPPVPKAGDAKSSVPVEVKLPDGTAFKELTVGTGAEATKGCKATVHYTGKLLDGTKFDSSLDRNIPFDVQPLGDAPVIKGWNVGLIGMKEGGKRRLTIPSASGYGPNGSGPIPPNATLVFDVELLKVSK